MAIETTHGDQTGAPALDRYEAVIGLEVHCQLRTASKMFCACATAYDGAAPNTHVCPVCLGPARRAAGHQPAGRRARARDRPRDRGHDARGAPGGTARTTSTRTCRRATRSASTTCRWRRPAGSRSSLGRARSRSGSPAPTSRRTRPSSSTPRADDGRQGQPGRLQPLRRAADGDRHRARHPDRRAGPALRRGAPAAAAHIGASDADMEHGQMRVEANISLRPRGTEAFGTRVEVKNMNSFRAVERAIAFEIERQAAALDAARRSPGDPRLDRRPRRDVPHALEGDVRRLPLLPGARPAATPRRAGVARGAPGGAAGAAGGPARALPGRSA